jgi:poly-gamma-glutamate synthesis protein (capsule biosynthesis protein)
MIMQWKALFVGDIVISGKPHGQFPSPAFSSIMKDHAICSCNFEAPIEGKGQPIKKAGPHLQQPANAVAYVEDAGFNVVSLANNHMYDYGPEALTATIAAFKNAITVGAGMNFEEAYALKKINVRGINVGFLSFCEAEFGALTVNSINQSGYAWINHPKVNSLVIEARKSVDVLILQCHAGVEEVDVPLPQWKERYKELVRMGADAIIGSHPHVPQGWELYEGKPIFYSLGNFYVDLQSNNPLWNTGLAISLTFNNADFESFDVIPIRRIYGKNPDGEIAINQDEHFQKHLNNINSLLQEPAYSKTIDDIAIKLWNEYYRNYYDIALRGIHGSVGFNSVVKRFIKRILSKKSADLNSALLLHNIRIESHRWIVERVLEMQNSL